MSGKKGRSGAWNKRKELDYQELRRLSLATLLRIQRNKNYDDDKRFKSALDVTLKELQKPIIDQSNHNHVTYIWDNGNENNQDQLQATDVPERNTQ